jgi:hypothetical protein
VEGLEHRSQHRLNVLPQDASGVVEGSSKVGGGKVVVTVAVLKRIVRSPYVLVAKKIRTYEVAEGGCVDHVVAMLVIGTRGDRVSVPDCSRRRSKDGSTSGSLAAVEVVTERLVGKEARHLPDTGLVVAT